MGWRKTESSGYTLMELIIAIGLGGIILMGLSRLFLNSQWSYNVQDQIVMMNQNAHFTIKKMTEVLSELGADLPNGGWTVARITANPADSIEFDYNPRGGYQVLRDTLNSEKNIPVDDANGFRNAKLIRKIFKNNSSSPVDFEIDDAYNGNGFANGLKIVPGGYDFIRLKTPEDFIVFDTIYSFGTKRYHMSGTDLLFDGEVLAENIDTLEINFWGADSVPTTVWEDMKYVYLKVTAKTERSDSKYPGDGHRRTTLDMAFRLKNKF